MAMINCKECKQEVSSKAKVCPHCGVKEPGFGTSDKIGSAVIGILFVLGIVYFLYDGETEQQPKYNHTTDNAITNRLIEQTTPPYQQRVNAYEQAIANGQINSTSIKQFRSDDKAALESIAKSIDENCVNVKETNNIDDNAYYLCNNISSTYKTTLRILSLNSEGYAIKADGYDKKTFEDALNRAKYAGQRIVDMKK